MMVRTIQHPGVQIQESEIGGYRSTVVMNNAYIMGFADRGPIYDYSWITTTKEFTKIYGEPQTEAEKYLFIAVQSVLQNGGTPIVARMPYDNKQCKAYKAMKIKWTDIDPDNNRLDTPVVPLSTVTARVNHNKDLSAIFTTKSVSINDQLVDEDFLESLSLIDIAKQLNPYETGSPKSGGKVYDDFIYGFKVNGVYPSGLNINANAISASIQSLKADMTEERIKVLKYDQGYNRILNESVDPKYLEEYRFVSSDDVQSGNVFPIYNIYADFTDGKNHYKINLFNTETVNAWNDPIIVNTSTGEKQYDCVYMNANNIPNDFVDKIVSIIK